jgi:hypothetical protein
MMHPKIRKRTISLFCYVFSISLLFHFSSSKLYAQQDLNLDFETVARDGNYPVEWKSSGSHIGFLDEKIKKHGINSVRLQLTKDADSRDNSYYSQTLVLAEKQGKEITFRGYIKTEDVGSAGLFIRAESGISYFKLETTQFDKMDGRRLSGTNDWTAILVKVPFDTDLYRIEFGVYIEGKGKVWVDDCKLMIDGKPYNLAAERVAPTSTNDADKEKNSSFSKKKAIAEEKARQEAKSEAKKQKG